MASSILRTGSELVSLLPTHTRHWWPIIEDIFTSTDVKRIDADIMNDFCRSKEFEYVSIDATIKCCMSVMGQESYRASREKRTRRRLMTKPHCEEFFLSEDARALSWR